VDRITILEVFLTTGGVGFEQFECSTDTSGLTGDSLGKRSSGHRLGDELVHAAVVGVVVPLLFTPFVVDETGLGRLGGAVAFLGLVRLFAARYVPAADSGTFVAVRVRWRATGA